MRKINRNRVLLIGGVFIDVIAKVQHVPETGQDIPGEMIDRIVGGCAYNVANVLKQLDVEYDLMVPIGRGIHADIIKKAFNEEGHKLFIEDSSKDNGWSLSLVEESGERTFITFNGIEENWKDEWFSQIHFEDYRYIYLTGYSLEGQKADVILNRLSKNSSGGKIIFDPSPRISVIKKEHLEKLFALRPIVHSNLSEILELTGEPELEQAVRRLHQSTQSEVVVTLGPKGSFCYNGEHMITLDGKKVPVVDTIGAGDAHTGAFIASLLHGQSLEKACEQGNEAAAQAVQVQGGKFELNPFC
ncbi:PfkB family carbohydrate kinase [Paenibacillus macerans]|uniref:PfkB family carbohydrate kinase n=1 Tax=Paenibacillus macerans TaxID=44252 RepID=UPI001F0DD1F3|nr:PfkB family carbohydrate kinase [Paenibacillus macerans]UMV47790.1 PfkB family carbohydrate kinase [Paenibacillus macerans]